MKKMLSVILMVLVLMAPSLRVVEAASINEIRDESVTCKEVFDNEVNSYDIEMPSDVLLQDAEDAITVDTSESLSDAEDPYLENNLQDELNSEEEECESKGSLIEEPKSTGLPITEDDSAVVGDIPEMTEEYFEEPLVGASTGSYKFTFTYGQTEARSMLNMVNSFRTGSDAWYWAENNSTKVYCSGLSRLTYDYQLEKVAMLRAREIAVSYGHQRPKGTRSFTAYSELGYVYNSAAENIAYGYPTANSVYMAWREDNDSYSGQGHRRNMLNGDFNRIGIGHVIYQGQHYWVQEFAKSTSAISTTTANDSTTTATVEISDSKIASCKPSSSASSITLEEKKSVSLPDVYVDLEVLDEYGRSSSIRMIPEYQWKVTNSNIASIQGKNLVGVSMGKTELTTVVNNTTLSVPITVNSAPIVVGDNVTARIVVEGSKKALYFTSKNGTLWNEWKDKVGDRVYNLDAVKFSSDSGKMYLPENSRTLFSGLEHMTQIDLSKADSSKVKDMRLMFSNCKSLTALDVSYLDTSNVEDMQAMFGGSNMLKSLDLGSFDTTKVKSIFLMFANCTSLKSINLSSFYTPNLNKMMRAFSGCSSLETIDLRAFDTTHVTSMNGLFIDCHSLKTVNINGLDMSNKDLSQMFDACTSLTKIDLSSLDFSTITDTKKMFNGCNALSEIKTPKKFNTDKRIELPDTFVSDEGHGFVYLSKAVPCSIILRKYDPANPQQIDISSCYMPIFNSFTYDGTEKRPEPVLQRTTYWEEKGIDEDGNSWDSVSSGWEKLEKDIDYNISYKDNINAGTGSIIATGKGRYKGTLTIPFNINKANPTFKFSSTSLTKSVEDSSFTNTLTCKTDGTITYSSSNTAVAVVNKSTGQITIKGEGSTTITVNASEGKNYNAGSASYTLKVVDTRVSITNCTISLSPTSYTYDGSAKQPTVTVMDGVTRLVLNTSYTVDYSNNINAGTAAVKVTGKGHYKGTKTVTFAINKAAAKLTFASSNITKKTTDAAFTNKLTAVTDGTVTYKSSNTSVAVIDSVSGKVTIKGIGTTTITAAASEGKNYKSGNASYVLKVEDGRIDVSGLSLTISPTSYTFDGKEKRPAVTLKNGATTLINGTDYSVAYKNNINAGTATVVITGNGKYKGEKSATFKINKATPKLVFAESSLTKKSTDDAFTNKLTKTTDGAVTFKSDNTKVATVNSTSGKVAIKGIGTATIVATASEGTNYKAGSAQYTLKIIDGRTDVSGLTVSLSATSYTYDGNEKKPSVTVKNGDTKLTVGTDYTVSYANNINAGSATVKITGNGSYKGTKSVKFTILKAAPKLTFAKSSISKTNLDSAFTNKLTKTTDGTVTFKSGNTKIATINSTSGKVTIKGVGKTTITATAAEGANYNAGSAKYTLTIVDGRTDISGLTVVLSETSYTYDGKEKKPTVTVKDGDLVLISETDYIVSYENNTNSGTAAVKVEGIGKYKGEMILSFSIKPATSGFSDVQDPTHPYYKAIYWAADAGITKGYPDGTFGIDRSCTRGEMIMFLWRYLGKPSPIPASKSPFPDVPTNHAFYNAILWASQTGITKGYPDGTFGINRNVSRGECMMFLWRIKGKPASTAVSVSPFTDVPKNHAFYNAILWGYQNKITNGYTSGPKKGTFGINEDCTRGAIVTFLYRAK